jgi:hypothetical protein
MFCIRVYARPRRLVYIAQVGEVYVYQIELDLRGFRNQETHHCLFGRPQPSSINMLCRVLCGPY